MDIKITDAQLDVILASLYDSKHSLKKQLKDQTARGNHARADLIGHQLDEVLDVIKILEGE